MRKTFLTRGDKPQSIIHDLNALKTRSTVNGFSPIAFSKLGAVSNLHQQSSIAKITNLHTLLAVDSLVSFSGANFSTRKHVSNNNNDNRKRMEVGKGTMLNRIIRSIENNMAIGSFGNAHRLAGDAVKFIYNAQTEYQTRVRQLDHQFNSAGVTKSKGVEVYQLDPDLEEEYQKDLAQQRMNKSKGGKNKSSITLPFYQRKKMELAHDYAHFIRNITPDQWFVIVKAHVRNSSLSDAIGIMRHMLLLNPSPKDKVQHISNVQSIWHGFAANSAKEGFFQFALEIVDTLYPPPQKPDFSLLLYISQYAVLGNRPDVADQILSVLLTNSMPVPSFWPFAQIVDLWTARGDTDKALAAMILAEEVSYSRSTSRRSEMFRGSYDSLCQQHSDQVLATLALVNPNAKDTVADSTKRRQLFAGCLFKPDEVLYESSFLTTELYNSYLRFLSKQGKVDEAMILLQQMLTNSNLHYSQTMLNSSQSSAHSQTTSVMEVQHPILCTSESFEIVMSGAIAAGRFREAMLLFYTIDFKSPYIPTNSFLTKPSFCFSVPSIEFERKKDCASFLSSNLDNAESGQLENQGFLYALNGMDTIKALPANSCGAFIPKTTAILSYSIQAAASLHLHNLHAALMHHLLLIVATEKSIRVRANVLEYISREKQLISSSETSKSASEDDSNYSLQVIGKNVGYGDADDDVIAIKYQGSTSLAALQPYLEALDKVRLLSTLKVTYTLAAERLLESSKTEVPPSTLPGVRNMYRVVANNSYLQFLHDSSLFENSAVRSLAIINSLGNGQDIRRFILSEEIVDTTSKEVSDDIPLSATHAVVKDLAHSSLAKYFNEAVNGPSVTRLSPPIEADKYLIEGIKKRVYNVIHSQHTAEGSVRQHSNNVSFREKPLAQLRLEHVQREMGMDPDSIAPTGLDLAKVSPKKLARLRHGSLLLSSGSYADVQTSIIKNAIASMKARQRSVETRDSVSNTVLYLSDLAKVNDKASNRHSSANNMKSFNSPWLKSLTWDMPRAHIGKLSQVTTGSFDIVASSKYSSLVAFTHAPPGLRDYSFLSSDEVFSDSLVVRAIIDASSHFCSQEDVVSGQIVESFSEVLKALHSSHRIMHDTSLLLARNVLNRIQDKKLKFWKLSQTSSTLESDYLKKLNVHSPEVLAKSAEYYPPSTASVFVDAIIHTASLSVFAVHRLLLSPQRVLPILDQMDRQLIHHAFIVSSKYSRNTDFASISKRLPQLTHTQTENVHTPASFKIVGGLSVDMGINTYRPHALDYLWALRRRVFMDAMLYGRLTRKSSDRNPHSNTDPEDAFTLCSQLLVKMRVNGMMFSQRVDAFYGTNTFALCNNNTILGDPHYQISENRNTNVYLTQKPKYNYKPTHNRGAPTLSLFSRHSERGRSFAEVEAEQDFDRTIGSDLMKTEEESFDPVDYHPYGIPRHIDLSHIDGWKPDIAVYSAAMLGNAFSNAQGGGTVQVRANIHRSITAFFSEMFQAAVGRPFTVNNYLPIAAARGLLPRNSVINSQLQFANAVSFMKSETRRMSAKLGVNVPVSLMTRYALDPAHIISDSRFSYIPIASTIRPFKMSSNLPNAGHTLASSFSPEDFIISHPFFLSLLEEDELHWKPTGVSLVQEILSRMKTDIEAVRVGAIPLNVTMDRQDIDEYLRHISMSLDDSISPNDVALVLLSSALESILSATSEKNAKSGFVSNPQDAGSSLIESVYFSAVPIDSTVVGPIVSQEITNLLHHYRNNDFTTIADGGIDYRSSRNATSSSASPLPKHQKQNATIETSSPSADASVDNVESSDSLNTEELAELETIRDYTRLVLDGKVKVPEDKKFHRPEYRRVLPALPPIAPEHMKKRHAFSTESIQHVEAALEFLSSSDSQMNYAMSSGQIPVPTAQVSHSAEKQDVRSIVNLSTTRLIADGARSLLRHIRRLQDPTLRPHLRLGSDTYMAYIAALAEFSDIIHNKFKDEGFAKDAYRAMSHNAQSAFSVMQTFPFGVVPQSNHLLAMMSLTDASYITTGPGMDSTTIAMSPETKKLFKTPITESKSLKDRAEKPAEATMPLTSRFFATFVHSLFKDALCAPEMLSVRKTAAINIALLKHYYGVVARDRDAQAKPLSSLKPSMETFDSVLERLEGPNGDWLYVPYPSDRIISSLFLFNKNVDPQTISDDNLAGNASISTNSSNVEVFNEMQMAELDASSKNRKSISAHQIPTATGSNRWGVNHEMTFGPLATNSTNLKFYDAASATVVSEPLDATKKQELNILPSQTAGFVHLLNHTAMKEEATTPIKSELRARDVLRSEFSFRSSISSLSDTQSSSSGRSNSNILVSRDEELRASPTFAIKEHPTTKIPFSAMTSPSTYHGFFKPLGFDSVMTAGVEAFTKTASKNSDFKSMYALFNAITQWERQALKNIQKSCQDVPVMVQKELMAAAAPYFGSVSHNVSQHPFYSRHFLESSNRNGVIPRLAKEDTITFALEDTDIVHSSVVHLTSETLVLSLLYAFGLNSFYQPLLKVAGDSSSNPISITSISNNKHGFVTVDFPRYWKAGNPISNITTDIIDTAIEHASDVVHATLTSPIASSCLPSIERLNDHFLAASLKISRPEPQENIDASVDTFPTRRCFEFNMHNVSSRLTQFNDLFKQSDKSDSNSFNIGLTQKSFMKSLLSDPNTVHVIQFGPLALSDTHPAYQKLAPFAKMHALGLPFRIRDLGSPFAISWLKEAFPSMQVVTVQLLHESKLSLLSEVLQKRTAMFSANKSTSLANFPTLSELAACFQAGSSPDVADSEIVVEQKSSVSQQDAAKALRSIFNLDKPLSQPKEAEQHSTSTSPTTPNNSNQPDVQAQETLPLLSSLRGIGSVSSVHNISDLVLLDSLVRVCKKDMDRSQRAYFVDSSSRAFVQRLLVHNLAENANETIDPAHALKQRSLELYPRMFSPQRGLDDHPFYTSEEPYLVRTALAKDPHEQLYTSSRKVGNPFAERFFSRDVYSNCINAFSNDLSNVSLKNLFETLQDIKRNEANNKLQRSLIRHEAIYEPLRSAMRLIHNAVDRRVLPFASDIVNSNNFVNEFQPNHLISRPLVEVDLHKVRRLPAMLLITYILDSLVNARIVDIQRTFILRGAHLDTMNSDAMLPPSGYVSSNTRFATGKNDSLDLAAASSTSSMNEYSALDTPVLQEFVRQSHPGAVENWTRLGKIYGQDLFEDRSKFLAMSLVNGLSIMVGNPRSSSLRSVLASLFRPFEKEHKMTEVLEPYTMSRLRLSKTFIANFIDEQIKSDPQYAPLYNIGISSGFVMPLNQEVQHNIQSLYACLRLRDKNNIAYEVPSLDGVSTLATASNFSSILYDLDKVNGAGNLTAKHSAGLCLAHYNSTVARKSNLDFAELHRLGISHTFADSIAVASNNCSALEKQFERLVETFTSQILSPYGKLGNSSWNVTSTRKTGKYSNTQQILQSISKNIRVHDTEQFGSNPEYQRNMFHMRKLLVAGTWSATQKQSNVHREKYSFQQHENESLDDLESKLIFQAEKNLLHLNVNNEDDTTTILDEEELE